ncbi:MAG TPA: hypothetical protein VFL57_06930, partial [Bryobacteraceae bacterium]|nr:hypothetical protein [Bryobacteraceae bacterium]
SAMQGEVERIFAPAQADVDVLLLRGALEVRRADRIIHMDVKGTCASITRRRTTTQATLGVMFGVDRELQPIGSVDCQSLSGYLGAVSPETFGRALGRVLAHEVYHYVTQRRNHSERGLFAASLSDLSLTRPELSFTDEDLDALNGRLKDIGKTAAGTDGGM